MNEVEKLQADLRDAAFTLREVAGALESEREDWERRGHTAASERRIEQLRGELAYQRDKLRRHAQDIEKSVGDDA